MRHVADSFIGLPWLPHGDTREGVSCWGLVVLYYREVLGIELPNYPQEPEDFTGISEQAEATIASGEWVPVDKPQDGDVVLMSHRLSHCHFGLWVAGGVLHISAFTKSVVHQRLLELKKHRYGRIRYVRKSA